MSVNERDGKKRECEDDDVLWNEMSVPIIMFVSLSRVNKNRCSIKNQTHSCISHQMKVVNVGPELNRLRQD